MKQQPDNLKYIYTHYDGISLGASMRQILSNFNMDKRNHLSHLQADWPFIIGERLAKSSWPSKIAYVKPPPSLDELYDDQQDKKTPFQAHLTIEAIGALATEISYGKDNLIKQINQYLGIPLCKKLKISSVMNLSRPNPIIHETTPPNFINNEKIAKEEANLSHISSANLRRQIARLHALTKDKQ